jgi:hypothetical protein
MEFYDAKCCRRRNKKKDQRSGGEDSLIEEFKIQVSVNPQSFNPVHVKTYASSVREARTDEVVAIAKSMSQLQRCPSLLIQLDESNRFIDKCRLVNSEVESSICEADESSDIRIFEFECRERNCRQSLRQNHKKRIWIDRK